MPAASAAAAALAAAPAKAVELAGKGLQAKANTRIRKAAKDFEAILAEQLLKTARRSTSRSSLFPRPPAEIHEGMVDEHLARAMTRGRGFGWETSWRIRCSGKTEQSTQVVASSGRSCKGRG
jgi:Rod binding domain-containing protein